MKAEFAQRPNRSVQWELRIPNRLLESVLREVSYAIFDAADRCRARAACMVSLGLEHGNRGIAATFRRNRQLLRSCDSTTQAVVAAGAKRKTIELNVRSTTPRSTDPRVGYKHQSRLKLEYIRQENGTSTDCAFSGQVDYFWACPSSCNIRDVRIVWPCFQFSPLSAAVCR